MKNLVGDFSMISKHDKPLIFITHTADNGYCDYHATRANLSQVSRSLFVSRLKLEWQNSHVISDFCNEDPTTLRGQIVVEHNGPYHVIAVSMSHG